MPFLRAIIVAFIVVGALDLLTKRTLKRQIRQINLL